jgi:FkbM family methyltransferase
VAAELVVSKLGNPASGKLQTFTDVMYIANPQMLRLTDIKTAGVNTAGMIKAYLHVPDTNPKQTVEIFGFASHEDEHVSASVSYHGGWEKNLVNTLCSKWNLQGAPGSNFLDLGANIGVFTLTMAGCLHNKGGGEVIAIEANPAIAEHLKAGILANHLSNVALYPYAVGDPDPRNSMPMKMPAHNKGGSSVGWNNTGGTASAQLTTMDAILQNNVALQKVLAAKVDIEGSEGRMLNGGKQFISMHAPCFLIIELTPALLAKAGTPHPQVVQTLSGAGYGSMTALPGAPDHYYTEQKDVPACIGRVSQR